MELFLGFLWVVQSIFLISLCLLGSLTLSEFFPTESLGFGPQHVTVVFRNPSS